MKASRAVLPVLIALSAFACGKEESKDEQAEKFYDEKLHTDEQKTCNAAGNLYDALDAECKTTIKLATWECTRAELGNHSKDTTNLATLDGYIADGYELHQCGEADGAIFLVIVNKGKTEKEATLEIRHMLLAGIAATTTKELRFSSPVSAVVGSCLETGVEYWATADADKAAPSKTTSPGDVTFALTIDQTGGIMNVYKDDACTTEFSDITLMKLENGEDTLPLFFKFTAAGIAFLKIENADDSIQNPEDLKLATP